MQRVSERIARAVAPALFAPLEREGVEFDGTGTWRARRQIGRVRIDLLVMRHRYPQGTPDRWVIQPTIVFDRKRVAR